MRRAGQADEMTPESITYPGYRFPAEIIGHAVWLYHLFSLSLRDVELILAGWTHCVQRAHRQL